MNMPNDLDMGGEEQMGMQDNSQGMPEQEGEFPSNFDTNFDAGVEADEETDPKTYIQQLTGKLSQTLNTYNNENGEPDVELGKYVLGMLIKQGVKGMDDKDKKDIIKKINTDDTEINEIPEGDDESETPEMSDENSEFSQQANESKTIKLTKKQIFESFGLVNNDTIEKDEKEDDSKISKDVFKNNKTRPFQAPKFKE
jgi:hypothetical protein